MHPVSHQNDRNRIDTALPCTSTPILIVLCCSFQCLSKDSVVQGDVQKLAVTCNSISLQTPTFCSTCNNYCFHFRLSGCSQKNFSELALSFENYSSQKELVHIHTSLHVELFPTFPCFLWPSLNFLHCRAPELIENYWPGYNSALARHGCRKGISISLCMSFTIALTATSSSYFYPCRIQHSQSTKTITSE